MLVEINQHSYYYQIMSYSFEYIDIILLAMIAGFIFLRLRGILGKRTGFEGKAPSEMKEVLNPIRIDQNIVQIFRKMRIFRESLQEEITTMHQN